MDDAEVYDDPAVLRRPLLIAWDRCTSNLAATGPARRAASGFGLIESLIALMLASMVILSLATGLLTLVRAHGATAERQQIQLVLTNYSERVRALPYLPCATAAQYGAALSALPPSRQVPRPPDMNTPTVAVTFWSPGSADFSGTCDPAAAPSEDSGIQEITMTLAWRGRTGDAQVVLRNEADR